MSGKQAKKLRKQIYGADYSPRHRQYRRAAVAGRPGDWIVADERRQAYQKAKGRGAR